MTRKQLSAVLAGGFAMSLGLGIRQSYGLFLEPMGSHFGIDIAVMSMAVAVHNLMWGASQPILGAIADRRGATPVIAFGAFCFSAGLLLVGLFPTAWAVLLGLGVLTGIGMGSLGFSVSLASVARAFPMEQRSQVIGLASAGGSVGQMLFLPLIGAMLANWGPSWTFLIVGLAVLTGLPAGKPIDAAVPEHMMGIQRLSGIQAARIALADRDFVLLTLGFFTCGFQLVFIATHLPTYLHLCDMPSGLAPLALMTVGGFNIIGSWLAGQAGARLPPQYCLAAVYLTRGLAILVFFLSPKSELGTLVFAAVMGTLWLSTVPLTSTVIARMFGMGNLGALYGVAFLSHQLGSFLGALMGGLVFKWTGSYDLIWMATAAAGVTAALFNLPIRVTSKTAPA